MQNIPRPTDERVILQPLPPEETTAGGLIHIPQTGRKQTLRGRVLAVGRGKVTERGVRVEPSFRAGDEVLYAEYNNAQPVGRDKDGPVVLLIDDVLAVVE